MSIIKSSNKFYGNALQRNAQRIEIINHIKEDNNLSDVIKMFFESVKEYNLYSVKYIIENELFYEIVSIDIIYKYIKYINIFEDIQNDFERIYKLKAQNGFRRTIDYLINQNY
ncbi:hypothetical protein [Clostridioides difficile]|uniref:hypothetical protein n=1 Tax=Clostridioides difficile TaxID=1496 RepID=UPI0009800880|nr:hypothetical protein [Clostridioides difficile]MCR1707613.1 hypothetical protein [Clostridioides difficile]MDV9929202.1 hypothetical protein [Clostridioides difficile]SJO67003.1 Uncharacterised protein [Clostridioides difficile]SJX08886.1 Uncharacterised protein [Clostridioides difficile]HBF3270495.1 hypothetical protein [Clostridioides difficile]